MAKKKEAAANGRAPRFFRGITSEHEVECRFDASDGETYAFYVTFRYRGLSAYNKFQDEITSGDPERIRAAVEAMFEDITGWRAICDDQGNEVPFDSEALADLRNWGEYNRAIGDGWTRVQLGEFHNPN